MKTLTFGVVSVVVTCWHFFHHLYSGNVAESLRTWKCLLKKLIMVLCTGPMFVNSADKLCHTRSAYSAEQVLLNKQQIWCGGAYLHCYPMFLLLCRVLLTIEC